ncbi:hypothetical protein LGH70_17900 [Hymenobacter sp. BT635]|uniref:TonB C-terminal domain-containing protein n=1 Tax=Hymenobacter nitidus TaxID=2880929 RepID=A0ABS8AHZ5_9BACT|nr:hypothetical protein [Hymenobacter nitidus]MCB2379476.1 hypothetical protein [Hymenobacter nitidus]
MKYTCYALSIVLWLSSVVHVYATGQIPDRMIYKGDTLKIFANPLEQLYSNDSLHPAFFGAKEACESTACWRGYQATWEISEDNLYLVGIYSCCYNDDKVSADLKNLFGEKCINGRVKADWFTGKIVSPQGKLLYYVHMGYGSLYEKEVELQFESGLLIDTKNYDNSKSRISAFRTNPEKLKKFIYRNIDWNKIPNATNGKSLLVSFSANRKGVIDSVDIRMKDSSVYAKEAARVIKSIPRWDVLYRRGELLRMEWVVLISFSEENRKKYRR